MDLSELIELTEIQFRGVLAQSFLRAGIDPGPYWPMLRGEAEITMRSVGEIGHITGFEARVVLRDREKTGEKADHPKGEPHGTE